MDTRQYAFAARQGATSAAPETRIGAIVVSRFAVFPPQQLRQLGEIDRHPPRFVQRECASDARGIRIGATIEIRQALPGGIIYHIAAW
jgi:hypothetical protein